jgi:hypothetical protein
MTGCKTEAHDKVAAISMRIAAVSMKIKDPVENPNITHIMINVTQIMMGKL